VVEIHVQGGAESIWDRLGIFWSLSGLPFSEKKNYQQILSVNKKYIVIITLTRINRHIFTQMLIQICKFIL
jgi:hypothetical protein